MRPTLAMTPVLAMTMVLVAAWPAWAVEHTLLRWKKTGQCEIVTQIPLWGDHWTTLGEFPSRSQAERALAVSRKTHACPQSKSASRADKMPEERRPSITYHRPRTDDDRAVMFRDYRSPRNRR
ncbi:MAG: hypothetical protein H7Y60_01525 [Rhodospirillaceae bacterium]|nr:hypothetical protein [Rhodospirillales bacterium]